METKNSRRKLLRIEAFPRLHLTLLSLVSNSYRENGGLGFSITEPSLFIDFYASSSLKISDVRSTPLDISQISQTLQIVKLIAREQNFEVHPEIIIGGAMPAHSGFGSGTAARLAIIDGISRINGLNKNKDQLIKESARGGTSGVGINTYFTGQMIFDLGRPSKSGQFVPSEFSNGDIFNPLTLSPLVMPDWKIGVCVPNFAKLSLKDEKIFFERVCPLSLPDCAEAVFHSLFGIFAAAKENDYHAFCDAVKAIQKTKWKREERILRGIDLENAEKILYKNGADCVGLSSFGPALFFLGQNVERTKDEAEKEMSDSLFFICKANNSGRVITNG